MIIDAPAQARISQLKALWKEAFGDPDSFIDLFFKTAYDPRQCEFLMMDGQLAAALYWLDCDRGEEKLAYIYAVATAEAFQGRGLCRQLMDRSHQALKARDYAGAVLVPGSESLFRMYEKMGYAVCSHVREWECAASTMPAAMKKLTAGEYAALRRKLLPENGTLQEGKSLSYLASYAQLWGGNDFCAALMQEDDRVICTELLGNADRAPEILAALGAESGSFRGPGTEKPFAMYRALNGGTAPDYFGLAFD